MASETAKLIMKMYGQKGYAAIVQDENWAVLVDAARLEVFPQEPILDESGKGRANMTTDEAIADYASLWGDDKPNLELNERDAKKK